MNTSVVGCVAAVLSDVGKELVVVCAFTQCSVTEDWFFHSEQYTGLSLDQRCAPWDPHREGGGLESFAKLPEACAALG